MIEAAYQQGEIPVWTEDEAGPYQTIPYAGEHWHPAGKPQRFAHEYVRAGTAKQLTLFHPQTGQVRAKGVTRATNAVLYPWLQEQLSEILARLPAPADPHPSAENRQQWERWQEGLTVRITLPAFLPPLRLLLVLDNLAGHLTPTFVLWLFAHGIMPLYTPLGGSWLNIAESIQRALTRRAQAGQHPQTADEIIAWLEATARGWNRHPTPFVWGGKRQARRQRAYARRHRLGGSGAYTKRPLAGSKAPHDNGNIQRE